jgi:hypothetical protein
VLTRFYSVSDVLVGQARVAFEEKAYQRAEGFLLRVRLDSVVVVVMLLCKKKKTTPKLTSIWLRTGQQARHCTGVLQGSRDVGRCVPPGTRKCGLLAIAMLILRGY